MKKFATPKVILNRKFVVAAVMMLLLAISATGVAYTATNKPAPQPIGSTAKGTQASKPGKPAEKLTPTSAAATAEQSVTTTITPTTSAPKKAGSTTVASSASKPAAPVAPSTTPTQTSFETIITRNGQVAPGTMIYYSASKGEKGFYGGDLVISRPNITISRSTYFDSSFTVTTPDGHTAGAPTLPWNDTNKSTYPVYSYSPAEGTNWTMNIQLGYGATNGTYTVHLTTSRTGQTADGWYYHGFMTVTVVD